MLSSFLPPLLIHLPCTSVPQALPMIDSSMEVCLDTTISESVHLQFEGQTCTLHHHLQCEIEIIKLDASCGRQTGEQTLWHGSKVCRERAYVDEIS